MNLTLEPLLLPCFQLIGTRHKCIHSIAGGFLAPSRPNGYRQISWKPGPPTPSPPLPSILTIKQLVRADDDPADWLLCTYEDQKKDVLKLTSKGEGGLEGLKKELKDDAAGWGYVAMG